MSKRNAVQAYTLYQLLKAGEVVSKELIAKELGVVVMSVPVYIHDLKKTHKADIVGVREGHKFLGYKLLSKDIDVPQLRKNSALFPKEAKDALVKKINKKKKTASVKPNNAGELPIIDPNADIVRISEREFADIADSLGVGGNNQRID